MGVTQEARAAAPLILSESYADNVRRMDQILAIDDSFDLLKKTIRIGQDELTLYYIDGFVKDGTMTKVIMHLMGLQGLDGMSATAFMQKNMPYVESEVSADGESILRSLLSGATVILGSSFGAECMVVDARSYPARDTSEPQGDLVMRGARDGFVETMIFNTALIRRRIRHPALTMTYFAVGKYSRSDVCLCYMKDRADARRVESLKARLSSLQLDALTMGQESLMEVLIPRRWYNPFPKIRMTERPDAAAAQLLEGSILLICDNSPQVMVLPTSIFDFLQETNDFYFPPLTGTYIRLLRLIIFFLALFFVPAWYLLVQHTVLVPPWLSFIIPEDTGRIPLFAQLLLVEFIIDGLRMASLNTPSMLSNSLSVVGGLILGDFAVQIGWLIPEVILYMAFVAIANYTQRSYELGYAIKFLRILLLLLTAAFGLWGFVAGVVIIIVLLATNTTADLDRSYLYPLIPFDGKALLSLVFRLRKREERSPVGSASDRRAARPPQHT
ncbi:MAG: spore germination protein [Clostridia bacterium]|nr:spore germination protein [Clostridia bacterium]